MEINDDIVCYAFFNLDNLPLRSRQLAETSPYMESLQSKDVEVLFCYEHYDELVLMNLGGYHGVVGCCVLWYVTIWPYMVGCGVV